MPDIYAGSHDTDFTAPRVENFSPTPGSSGHPVDVVVEFDLVDDSFYGPDLSNTTVVFSGEVGYTGGSFSSGYGGTVTAISNGYHFIFTTHPDFIGFITTQIDSQDTAPIPNVMDTYSATFSTAFDTSDRSVALPAGASVAQAASSSFQTKVGTITAGSKGNISLAASASQNTTEGQTFVLTTTKAGHLDKNLDQVVETTKELGVGQITYEEERVYRGSYEPPGFVADNGTYVYGADKTFSKLWYATNGSGDQYTSCQIIERNDDSLFVFANDPPSGSFAYSIPKVGKIDGSPVNRVSLGTWQTSAAVRITDDKFLLFYARNAFGSINAYIDFKLVDGSGALIEDLTRFQPFKRVNFVTNGFSNISAIRFGGAIYCTFSYTSNTAGPTSLYTIYTIVSRDEGRNWEFVREPGTSDYATVPQSFTSEIDDLGGSKSYSGQLQPRLSYDSVDDKILLTYSVQESGGDRRTITCTTEDFFTWSRLNFPIFKNNVAGTENEDLASGYANRVHRFAGKYTAVGIDTDGQYIAEFENDDLLYNLRKGIFWVEDSTSANKGALANSFDTMVDSGLMYVASPISSSATEQGFVVHVIGALTSLPDKTPYSAAWFGTSDKPSDGHGYTEQTTGAPTFTVGSQGLVIGVDPTERGWYTRADVPVGTTMINGLKVKAIVKPTTGVLASDSQRIRVQAPTTSASYTCYFDIVVGTDGIRIIDQNAGGGSIDYTPAGGITDFVEILAVYVPDSTTTGKLRVFVNNWQNPTDDWLQIANTALGSSNDTTKWFQIGAMITNSSANEVIWKAVYFCDNELVTTANSDLLREITDGIVDYDDTTDTYDLEPIIMTPEGEEQLISDGIILTWYGLDAYEGDDWTFSIVSDFSSDNIFNKKGNYVWRTAYGSASSGTSTDQYTVIDADDNNLGMFIWDVAFMLNSNFRFAKVQACDDGTTWSTFELDINFDIESGTITATNSRSDNDLLVIEDSTKNWLHGEFKGQYVMLKKIFEQGISSPDNTYGNVAFKILDNGPTHLLISTKGLAVDELGSGGSKEAMNVVSGDDYIIYGTRKSTDTDALRTYRYLRVFIPASAAYGTAWSANNQPNLPNERGWQLGDFDVGRKVQFQDEPDYGYTRAFNENFQAVVEDDSRRTNIQTGRPFKTFTIRYSLLQDYDHEILEAMIHTANETAQPFWYVPDIVNFPEEVYLVRLVGGLQSSRFLPDYQRDEIVLEEVP